MEQHKQDMYDAWFGENPIAMPLHDAAFIEQRCKEYQERIINRYFPANKQAKILDIGSGYGFFMLACKESGYSNVSGIEVVEKCIQFAKETLHLEHVYNAEIFDYLESQSNNSFDVISAIDVLEHLEKADIINFFKLVHKKLTSGGVFFFQVPNAGSLPGMYIYNSDLTHTIPFTDILAKGLFQMSGFSNFKIETSYGSNSLKDRLLRIIRRPLAMLLAHNNVFAFSTNLIGIGTKQ